jgi:hypothetical protein
MIRYYLLLCCALTFAGLKPEQASSQVELFPTSHVNEIGAKISFLGSPSLGDRLVFDANNGFFDKGAFRAVGKYAAPDSDRQLIASHFEALQVSQNEPVGDARWYFWKSAVGAGEIKIFLEVPQAEAGVGWKLFVGENEFDFITSTSDGRQPQSIAIPLKADAVGLHVISIRKADAARTPKTKFKKIEAVGPGIDGAWLIRARWRPAAVHARYESSQCKDSKLWVFETQSTAPASSYSPITTAFGYFGASFNSDGLAAGGVNFSMWAANRNASTMPAVAAMPHLLATANPAAEFSGFGHEGSGVKIRNWIPYQDHPKSVIQALRVVRHEGVDTFYGYLFDEKLNRWMLFAAGRRPSKNNRGDVSLRAGSFCEIPGPPNVERTGDTVREVKRRGWFYGQDKKWHVADTLVLGDQATDTNRFVRALDEGWLLMGTGGIEMSTGPKVARLRDQAVKLPRYLSPKHEKQLFEVPVEIGNPKVSGIKSDRAAVSYPGLNAGVGTRATLYYGPVDCLTFVNRKLHNTEKKGASRDQFAGDRTWRFQTAPVEVNNSTAVFLLDQLSPGRTYFFRVLVEGQQGKSWAFETRQFKTLAK